MGKRNFTFNEDFYTGALQAVGSLSRLFSDSETPFFQYRFIENLFVKATEGQNISRKDAVFDAIVGGTNKIAVGVKTFILAESKNYKYEKIQEFTAIAGRTNISRLPDKQVVHLISKERNRRVKTESAAFNIDPSQSLYHCLIRMQGRAFVHEEPFVEIDIDKIKPYSAYGLAQKKFQPRTANIHFSDGINFYSYSRAKNVLYKKFELEKGENWKPIQIDISDNAFEKVYENFLDKKIPDSVVKIDSLKDNFLPLLDYIVLPLYSVKKGIKFVPEKSGLNQWNAGGRLRKFGEAYIPVPQIIHNIAPNFFPTNSSFNLFLPNNSKPTNASLCQAGNKALMSNPNDELCKWIFRVIDLNFKVSSFNRPPKRKPFTYEDLEKSGYDSVRITKISRGELNEFQVVFEPIDGYEEFLERANEIKVGFKQGQ